jgi:hypothetical protein
VPVPARPILRYSAHMTKASMLAAAGIIIVAAGGIWYFVGHSKAQPPAVAEAPPPAVTLPAEPAEQHPVPPTVDDGKPPAPLPPLNDSDTHLLAALSEIAGAAPVKNFLVPDNIVRRLVATIDNLANPKLAAQKLPVQSVTGVFRVQGDELHATVDPQNFARYQPLVAIIGSLDMQRVAQVYFHFYPLFQNAYQDLGYPSGYFNDRLVAVVDVLLTTPQPEQPIVVMRPRVLYEFADPALESLSAGQKILIRMGPDNAATIKRKLAELRVLLAAAPPKHP